MAKSLTNGQGADSAIVTVGVTASEHIGQAFAAIRKAAQSWSPAPESARKSDPGIDR